MSLRALSVLPLLGAFACSGGDAPPAAQGEVTADAREGEAHAEGSATRDTLVIGALSDIGSLMYIVAETAADRYVIEQISVPTIGSDFDCSLKKLPGYATSWEWSDDGKVLSLELRDDLHWEDGEPLTADDLRFTYDLVADPTVASPRLGYMENLVPGKRPLVIDDTHVEFHFTKAYDRDSQAAHVGLPLLPEHVLKDADRATLRKHAMRSNPLSYGPFRVAKWDPGQRIVLEPNPKFTGPAEMRARLKRVVFRVIPEYSTRLIELETGKIDLMDSINVKDADRLREEHPELRLVRRGWRFSDYIAWNLKNPMFQDVRVRRALAHAVDIESMIGKLLTSKTGERYARTSVSTITPALCGVHNDDITPLAHNVEQARALFAEAGWSDTDGDGILDKGGKPFRFTLSTNVGNQRRADIQVLVQAQLQAVGVKADLEKIEANKFFENLRQREYEAALAGWSAALFVDPTDVWHSDTPEKKHEFNFTSYANPEVDALIEKGLTIPDPAEAAPVWKEVQAKIYDDQPYLFLWWMDEIVAVHERFENDQIDILSLLHHLHEWEVPPEKVKYKR